MCKDRNFFSLQLQKKNKKKKEINFHSNHVIKRIHDDDTKWSIKIKCAHHLFVFSANSVVSIIIPTNQARNRLYYFVYITN